MWSKLKELWQELKRIWSQSAGTQSRPRRTRPQFQGTRPQQQVLQTQTQQTEPKKGEGWTKKQRIRLAVENKILALRMPQCRFYEHKESAKTNVTGLVKTSDGCKYKLKVLLGPEFPDVMPKMYVVSPHKVPKYGGGFVNDAGLSHKFHTRGKGPDGCVEICHCSSWDPSRNIASVLLRGVVWCEGHCRHLKTDKSIADYCDELQNKVPDN
jgi:hypothetical protein